MAQLAMPGSGSLMTGLQLQLQCSLPAWVTGITPIGAPGEHQRAVSSKARAASGGDPIKRANRGRKRRRRETAASLEKDETQDLSEWSQGCAGEKTWDASGARDAQERRHGTRAKGRGRAQQGRTLGYRRTPTQGWLGSQQQRSPDPTATPHSWRSIAKQGAVFGTPIRSYQRRWWRVVKRGGRDHTLSVVIVRFW
ncbi:hypothetical protein NDU88_001533 [Pleurodeles waltl]|uniref:Uncharacterized protein n=1 Tax=Pleurodeles waltl TaxID=8319 RepID=A0AAV7WIK9_PLEWA|nr:hypothetical protein NDU88_001533 [Pleurodeles waltl]